MRSRLFVRLTVITLLLSSGCVSTATWTKPNWSQADLDKDAYECELQARQAQPANNPFGPALRKEMFVRCMKVRGWTPG